MTDHRTRPRFGRLAAAFAALVVTLVALLGAMGVVPVGSGPAAASDKPSSGDVATLSGRSIPDPTAAPPADEKRTGPKSTASADSVPTGTALPDDSGQGRRVVFGMGDQRVWLVDEEDEVVRTYPVSGSLTDNLDAGTYEVYSQSRFAVGIDDSGKMQYFTRFAHGENAAIGFHSIPTKNGKALQSRSQLGTPQSHGCIRQALADARKLYDFAPVGTKVVVTA